MILEQNIPDFADWIGPVAAAWLIAIAILLAIAFAIGALLALIWYGPSRFWTPFTQAVWRGVENASVSPTRTWAIALLTIKESIRRRVLLIFVMFLLLILMAGWFLGTNIDDPAALYLAFVTGATTILVLLLALFLSAFSLPTDFKSKTIYTVVTKPVRSSELILGRIIGISLVGTVILVLMGGASYVFVTSSLEQTHLLSEKEDLAPVDSADNTVDEQRVVLKGETRLSNGHKHPVRVLADGRIIVEEVNGHTHHVTSEKRGEQTRYTVEKEQGTWQARIPIYSKELSFRKSDGLEGAEGINVGDEWEYRSYVSGPEDGATASAAAIFSFEDVWESRFSPETSALGVPVEITMGVFRTHKGDIEKRINGSLSIRNPETGLRVEVMTFSTEEFITKALLIPRKFEGAPQIVQRQGRDAKGNHFIAPSGEVAEVNRHDIRFTQRREFDIFEDFITREGKAEIWLQCLDRGQYVGVAKADLYFRAADASVTLNFVKGFYKIWMQMIILISFGVLFSTFLSGPVAMLSTIGILIAGFAKSFVIELGFNRALGGGPFESLYRLLIQQNMVVDLPTGPATQFIKAADVVYSKLLLLVGQAVPPLSEYAVYDNALVSGFNIPMGWVLNHSVMTLAYAVPLFIVAYLILSNRETAQ